jgi:transcriptional regulator GlxA family with amidase domain
MSSRLDRIGDWITLAAESKYRTARLAAKCDVSRRQLERYFKAAVGQVPHEWLQEERLRHAPGLILESDTIKEVWLLLGYRSAAHFSRDFKRRYGMTPAKYKASPLNSHALKSVAWDRRAKG